ncbi:MAG: PqqD family protein [Dysgonamonadaceae bacterium]|jgi:hypothetical protein|nr:PqqD family protein [Dysgonamonadaceae bacterium]
MYAINKKKMFCDVADNFAIIINSETGIYYGINNFGTSVFEYLLKGSSPESVLEELNQLAGVPANMEQRLAAFIKELKDKEIIVEGATKQNEISFNPEYAEADEFNLKLAEYADAQELLLADPIHDVDAELGWQPVLTDRE